MKSSKLRKVGFILAGAVFVGAMALNFQSALLPTNLISYISLEELVTVAMASEEEEGETAYCDTLVEETYDNPATCNGLSKDLWWRRDFTCSTGGSGQTTTPYCIQGYLINQRQKVGYDPHCYFSNWNTTTDEAYAYDC